MSLGNLTGTGPLSIAPTSGTVAIAYVNSISQSSLALSGFLAPHHSVQHHRRRQHTQLSLHHRRRHLRYYEQQALRRLRCRPRPIASIAAWIASGYNGGAWNGTGIMSTIAQTDPNYGIGYADSADPGNPANLASGQIEVMYTLLGDANLDGKVNGTDFNLMAANFNQSVTDGWDEGDFNYDGKVNGNDFVLLADNFNQFASQSAVSAADVERWIPLPRPMASALRMCRSQ